MNVQWHGFIDSVNYSCQSNTEVHSTPFKLITLILLSSSTYCATQHN